MTTGDKNGMIYIEKEQKVSIEDIQPKNSEDVMPGLSDIRIKPPEKYAAKKALPDRREESNLTWREAVKNPPKFDDERKGIFLQHYSMTKRQKHSAMKAGVCLWTVVDQLKEDEDFRKAYQEAENYYKDHIHEIHEDQLTGISEPIVGGKDKDLIIAYRPTFPNNPLLAMELKRTNPEYNEKHQVDLNVTGGVLVAPATMSMEEYMADNVKTITSADGETEINEDAD